MDIIETIENTGQFWYLVLVFGGFTIYFLLSTLKLSYLIIKEKKGIDSDVLKVIGALTIVVGIVGGLTFAIYSSGAQVYYKAKITDFNVIHENGYEIVDQEGEIYTLKKMEK